MITQEEILSKFPLSAPRDGQIDAIKYMLDRFEEGKKFAFLEAPCGAGKSVIAITAAQFFENSYYITATKILQDQLAREFGEAGQYANNMIDLKGRSAYECTYFKNNADKLKESKLITLKQYQEYFKYHSCADGHCRKNGVSKYDDPCLNNYLCLYYNQIAKAQSANICLMNFSSFLYQSTIARRFGHRKLMIIDEGHNIESQLLDFVSISLDESILPAVSFPDLEDARDYATWMEDQMILQILDEEINGALSRLDMRKADELASYKFKIGKFIEEMEDDDSRWVHEIISGKAGRKLVLKPIFVYRHAHRYLFNYADHVIIMSATILNVNVMTKSLGINKDQMSARRMFSRFPVENHPINYDPVAKFSGGPEGMKRWGPLLVNRVNEIMDIHAGQRGIIHTHNFAIADLLLNNCNSKAKSRFLFQRNFDNDKAVMLDEHSGRTDSVIVAPAMHEGIDLRDSLSRFQIICKVPYPNFFDDKQLAARKDVDPAFYDWLVALKITQSVGRSVRSETDWATTYILDESFNWFYYNNKAMLPPWFVDCLKGI